MSDIPAMVVGIIVMALPAGFFLLKFFNHKTGENFEEEVPGEEIRGSHTPGTFVTRTESHDIDESADGTSVHYDEYNQN